MAPHSRQLSSSAPVSWPQQMLAIGICCLGWWCGAPVLAQSPPSIAPIPSGPGANIDQIVLPPAQDVPEEVLRTEIIFEARSPLDGTPMTPADYAQLKAELAAPQTTLTLNSDLRYIIFLLQARRAFKPVVPFLP